MHSTHTYAQTYIYTCACIYFYRRMCYAYTTAILKQPLLCPLVSALSSLLLCLGLSNRTDLAEKVTLCKKIFFFSATPIT